MRLANVRGALLVRIGGGFQSLASFCKQYADREMRTRGESRVDAPYSVSTMSTGSMPNINIDSTNKPSGQSNNPEPASWPNLSPVAAEAQSQSDASDEQKQNNKSS